MVQAGRGQGGMLAHGGGATGLSGGGRGQEQFGE